MTITEILRATDEEVGPACSNVPVPATIVMDDDFREAYVQGYRHALADVRRELANASDQQPSPDVPAPPPTPQDGWCP